MPSKQTTVASMRSVITLRDPSIAAARMDLDLEGVNCTGNLELLFHQLPIVLVNCEKMTKLTTIYNVMNCSVPCIREDRDLTNVSVFELTRVDGWSVDVC